MAPVDGRAYPRRAGLTESRAGRSLRLRARAGRRVPARDASEGRPIPVKRIASAALPWLALAFALSPALVSLAYEIPRQPFAASVGVAPLLFARLRWLDSAGARARTDPHPADRAPALGAAIVSAGVGAELLGLAADARSIAHYGVPLAALGMAVATGHASARRVALGFWCVPLPISLYVLTTPFAEAATARLAGLPLRGWLPGLEIGGPLIRYHDLDLQLRVVDSGLHLAWLLALLAWFAWMRGVLETRRGLAVAAILLPAAFALQVLAVQIGIALLVGVGAEAARHWIHTGAWLAVALIGVAAVERAVDRCGESARNDAAP